MTDTRGTFRLHNVRQDMLNNEYVSIPNVWLSENQGQGYTKCYNQFQYKLNFSTDSATVSTHLPTPQHSTSATSSSTNAWYIGGEPSTYGSLSLKITYATDASDGSPSSRFTIPLSASGALAGETHSYFFGGIPSGSTHAQKLTFANDTTVSSPSSRIEGARYNVQTGTAGGANGYMFAGDANFGYSITQRISFANDTRSNLPSSSNLKSYNENPSYGNILPYWGAGKIQSTTHCYYAGGTPGGSTYTSTCQKLTFANETWTVNPSKMTRSLRYIGGFTAGSTKGAIVGGQIPPSGQGSSSIDFVTFETDTWATSPSFTLPSTPGGTAGAYSNQTSTTTIHDSLHFLNSPGLPVQYTRWFDSSPTNMKGYITGGIKLPWATAHTGTQKLDYSTETFSSPPANLPSVHSPSEMGSTGNASDGILATGSGGSGISKFTYSSETYTYTGNMPGNYQPYFRFQQGHTSTTAAYFSGGHYAYTGSHTYKMPYSSDVATYTPSANLTSKRDQLNGTGMSKHDSHGYVIGGYDPSVHSWGAGYTNSEKMTYSSDTFAILPGMMTAGGSRYSTAAVGITDLNGYWLTGVPSPSGVAGVKSQCGKVDFSTDTMSSLPNVPYNMIGKQQCALGGGDRVYFGGGWRSYAPSGPTNVSSLVSKIVCSTDDISLIPGGMPFGVDKAASVSQVENGFPIKSPDLASDGTSTAPTPTASTSDLLSPSLNTNAVFASGRQQTSSSTNNRSKLTFSNDTMASMPAFTVNYNGYGNGSSTTRGYLTGGWGTNSMGDTQNKRYYNQYSNDTSGQLPSSIPYNAGGYFSVNSATVLYAGGGGWSSGQYSNVHKMAFSNETSSDVPGMKLSMNLKNGAGVGDKTVGYVCGANYYNNWRSYISKITYSTETIATSPATLALTGSAPYYGCTGASSKTKGYIMAGNSTDRLTFSTDTISNLGPWSSGLSGTWPGTTANSVTAGYTSIVSPSPHLIKFTFATEGSSTIQNLFSPARGKAGGMSQAMFGGAYAPVPHVI